MNDAEGFLESKIDLGVSVRFGQDCIGAIVPFTIGNAKMVLIFPNFIFSEDKPKSTFANTIVGLSWDVNRDNNFGLARKYSPKDHSVQIFSCDSIVIRSELTVDKNTAKQIIASLQEWKANFLLWLQYSLNTDFEEESIKVSQADPESYLLLNNSKSESLKNNDQSISIMYSQSVLELADITKACHLSLKEIPYNYFLIVSACKHFNKGSYRFCVLDAATAFEMTLSKLLESCLKKNDQTVNELIRSKYNGINNLCLALKKFGVIKLNNSEVKKISKPRNHAIHEGYIVNKDEALDALNYVRKFVNDKDPL